ncbi:MAG: type IV pilus twitching motility protein PilT [Candidatus Omnitrophica bacterium]|nr:type IV pilus twitching motility protein PilT [Candidatus Omnitrophota bacterium]MBU4478503.1 type IV pilus twitching motility protein PilT [Candidatus Omnitrophota bacterium]MCG2704399.1 type IV pilus twitching motility protein PilT [Candidatus Omnitrophota bacterium]
MEILDLIRLSIEKNASDLHITVGLPPIMRIYGKLVPTELEALTSNDVEQLVLKMLNEDQRQKLEKARSIDFTYSYIGRFRVNVFYEKGYLAAALRFIPFEIPSLENLEVPPIVAELARKQRGLVLVTGPTGSGKSTTLAAMIDLINREDSCHIITVEDPIEYLHPHKKSIVHQREIYADTPSFSLALRDALREDPDVILVGEMRDLETISTAITAAETGHLVFATLHTIDAVQTIDRIIDVFSEGQQSQIRLQTSLSLQGVISQRLIPRADGKGRVAAIEAMSVTPAIANLIREKKTYQIYSMIETGTKEGMLSFNQSLADLCKARLIRINDALTYSNKPELLKRMLL